MKFRHLFFAAFLLLGFAAQAAGTSACLSVNFARLGWLQFGHSTGHAMPTTMKPTA